MEKLLLFGILCYSITNIAVYGSIFNSWRSFWEKYSPNFFHKLFTCFICLPFWVGAILSYASHLFNYKLVSPTYGIWGVDMLLVNIFLDACIGSGLAWLIHTFQETLERIGNK